LLPAAGRPAAHALAAEVDEARDALPRRAAGGGVVAAGEEGLGLAARQGHVLVALVVVRVVEVVDGGARLGHGRGPALVREGVALGDLGVARRAPLLDDGGRLF